MAKHKQCVLEPKILLSVACGKLQQRSCSRKWSQLGGYAAGAEPSRHHDLQGIKLLGGTLGL